MKNLRRSQLRFALALLASIVLLANGKPSWAAPVATAGSFSFKYDQNLIALDNYANISNLEAAIASGETGLEGSLMAAMSMDPGLASMWLPYTSILGMRETPGILLTNNPDSVLNIVGMEIQLSGDTKQFLQFESGEYFEKSYASGEYTYMDMNTYEYWRVDHDLIPANVEMQDGGKRFSMSFGNGGMKPGQATTFYVRTSTGMYLHNFFDEETLIDVTYQDPNTNETYTTGPIPFSEIDDFNNALVHQVAAGTRNGMHFSEMVSPYGIGGSIIPEPTSLILAATGICCMAFRRRRVVQIT